MATDNSKVIKELLEVIKNKVGRIDARQGIQSIKLSEMKDQLSVLNEKLDDFKVDLNELNKKADGILEFLHNVDEVVNNHEQRLKRVETVPVIAQVLK